MTRKQRQLAKGVGSGPPLRTERSETRESRFTPLSVKESHKAESLTKKLGIYDNKERKGA